MTRDVVVRMMDPVVGVVLFPTSFTTGFSWRGGSSTTPPTRPPHMTYYITCHVSLPLADEIQRFGE